MTPKTAATPLLATDPVTQALAAYRDAVHAQDVEAYAALYADDVRVFDMWNDWSVQGRAAWRAAAEAWFGSLGTDRVIVSADDVQSSVAGDLACGHALLTYAAVAPDGAVLRSMHNRISLTLKRRAAGWLIVHQHTSAPIDGTTLAVKFQR